MKMRSLILVFTLTLVCPITRVTAAKQIAGLMGPRIPDSPGP